MSYRDGVDIGFMACRETVPELWRLAGEVPDAMAELLKAADRAPSRPAPFSKPEPALSGHVPSAPTSPN
jgi:hypothetical protein